MQNEFMNFLAISIDKIFLSQFPNIQMAFIFFLLDHQWPLLF